MSPDLALFCMSRIISMICVSISEITCSGVCMIDVSLISFMLFFFSCMREFYSYLSDSSVGLVGILVLLYLEERNF